MDLNIRIGHGYDVHRLKEGRTLIIGGVSIPHRLGLDGHSDADVLVHAVIDALLGACGESDIGSKFPDTDDKYKGISSLFLLAETAGIIRNAGYEIINIDATVIAQKPKLSPYIAEMKSNISKALNISVLHVNVKATTEEHLGFSGREEGISAHAVTLVSSKNV